MVLEESVKEDVGGDDDQVREEHNAQVEGHNFIDRNGEEIPGVHTGLVQNQWQGGVVPVVYITRSCLGEPSTLKKKVWNFPSEVFISLDRRTVIS